LLGFELEPREQHLTGGRILAVLQSLACGEGVYGFLNAAPLHRRQDDGGEVGLTQARHAREGARPYVVPGMPPRQAEACLSVSHLVLHGLGGSIDQPGRSTEAHQLKREARVHADGGVGRKSHVRPGTRDGLSERLG
jgi:hypothetical protein